MEGDAASVGPGGDVVSWPVTQSTRTPTNAGILRDCFSPYLERDSRAFTMILTTVVRPLLYSRGRRKGAQGADLDDHVSEAIVSLWIWWCRQPQMIPQTPAKLLAYAITVLDHLVWRAHRRSGWLPAASANDDLDCLVAPDDDPIEDHPEFRLRQRLVEWSLHPPSNALPVLGPTLRVLPGLFDRLGHLPTAGELRAHLGLGARTARRRHRQVCEFISHAISEGEF